MENKVADRLAVSPLQDILAKAVVCKALGRINERISSELELDVDGLDFCFIGSCGLVWMILNGPRIVLAHVLLIRFVGYLQASEPTLQRLIVNIVRHTQSLIEVAC